MITVVGALKEELRIFIEANTILQKKTIEGGSLYITRDFHLLRTGIGWGSAAKVFNKYLEEYLPRKVVNIGTAGRLHLGIAVGSMHRVTQFHSEDHGRIIQSEFTDDMPVLSQSSCLTVERPLTESNARDKLYQKYGADLVDMEAYYLAAAAEKKLIPFYTFKIVSDSANEETEKEFFENYKLLSRELAENVIKYLDWIE